jgi:c-di-GMP-related signal transduction protein
MTKSSSILAIPSHPFQASPTDPLRFIGRQPILDARRRVYGYELLFRAGPENAFNGNPDIASPQMIDTTLLFGMDNLVFGSRAFVNCSREALIHRLPTCLPAASTVLEVLETIEIDDDVFAACKELKQLGYGIALDDFLPGTSTDRLIPLADYIKLDFRACSSETLRSVLGRLNGSTASLIAEKVETEEEFKRAIDEGYDYFQGYFFSRPSILASHEIPANQIIYLELLAAISRPSSDRDEIDRLVGSDASLCYRLLRMVNAAGFGARGRVSSIRHALLLIGEAEFRKLVTIAAANCMGTSSHHSPELMTLCLQRARFCELLAPLAGQGDAEQYLIGMISVIDAMLSIPMEEVLKMLPLRPAAAAALLGEPSPVDLPLNLVRHYEQNRWDICADYCDTLGIAEHELAGIYAESLRWANKQLHAAL